MPVTKSRPAHSSAKSRQPATHLSNVSQRGLRAFTRSTKPGLPQSAGEKSSCVLESDANRLPSSSETIGGARKRKRTYSSDGPIDKTEGISHTKRQCKASQTHKPTSHVQSTETPKKVVSNPQCLPTPEHTPSYSSNRSSPSLKTPLKATPLENNSSDETALATAHSRQADLSHPGSPTTDLPDEVYDLIDLHSALLKSISLHFAHNGTTSPVDLQNLMPSVSKTWGRRRVTLEDVKRTLGILQSSAHANSSLGRDTQAENTGAVLQLYDYGGGRICLELNVVSPGNKFLARPLNEDELNALFESNISRLWLQYNSASRAATPIKPAARRDTATPQTPTSKEISDFISNLPLSPTPAHPSAQKSKTTTSRTLGQNRLTDLTGFLQKKKANSLIDLTTASSSTSTSSVKTPQFRDHKTRTSDLLSRLQARSDAQAQAQQSRSSPAQLARKAALHRIPEVVATLSLLRSSAAGVGGVSNASGEASTRQTYSLPALVQLIRESARGVLSAAEVERCLEVLDSDEDDVAGKGFVRIVRIGGPSGSVVGVVVDVGKRVGLGEVRARVARLLEEAADGL